LKTVCLARIGQDRVGVEIKNKLAQEKVNTRFLQIDQESFSGFSFLLASAQAKGHTAFLYRGANTKLEIEQKVIKKLRPRFFYVTSWSQKSWQRDLNRLLLAKGKAKIAWNPGNLQLKVKKIGLARYLKKIDVFDVNKDEAIELVLSDTSQKNKGKAFLNNPKNLLRLIQGWGPRIVVITDGHKGAYCGSAGKIYYSPASPKKKLDTTGAGDAFGSAFVAGLLLFNNDIKKSLHLGILNSGLVVSQVGAQGGIITRGEARRIIKRYG
jgi:sugar/nucleoside kinase (ribokinase family)